MPARSVVVATPPFGCSTAAVYRAWDELGGPRAEVNDLEPAAEHVEPRSAVFRREVEAAAGTTAILAGSGSSYAVVFADAGEAALAGARRGGRHGIGVARVHGRGRGAGPVVTHSVAGHETAAPVGRPLPTCPADDVASGSSSAASCASSCACACGAS